MKRENILAPSILAADFTRLGEDIQTVAAAVREVLYTAWRDAGRAHRPNGFFGQ